MRALQLFLCCDTDGCEETTTNEVEGYRNIGHFGRLMDRDDLLDGIGAAETADGWGAPYDYETREYKVACPKHQREAEIAILQKLADLCSRLKRPDKLVAEVEKVQKEIDV